MANPDKDLDTLIRLWDPAPADLTINVEALDHFYGAERTNQVLFDNHLKIGKGEIVILKGPSGSGKTTLLTLIGTLRNVKHGSLKILGQELNGISTAETNKLRKKIGFIFQAHNLFESLTATQNVRMATELVGMNSKEADRRILHVLQHLGLEDRLNHKPGSLSGGQKQRVAIARGIIHEPPLLLADEPTAALDAGSCDKVMELFLDLAKNKGKTIVIVTHDEKIMQIADRFIRMEYGRIIWNVLARENLSICSILSQFPVFEKLAAPTLNEIATKLNFRRYHHGEVVIRQGDIGKEFFLIGRGSVDIEIDGQVVNRLQQGEFFGEVALVEEIDTPRNATVRAVGDTCCFIVNKTEFQQAVGHQKFLDRIAEVIRNRGGKT